MYRFAHTDFSPTHGGVQRLTDSFGLVRRFAATLPRAKGLPGVLVAGGVAAAIVVADQIVSAWADGHLLLAWVAMWVVVFTLLALFSDAIGAWPTALRQRIAASMQASAQRAEDERTWAVAQSDPRVMAELQNALTRAQQQAEATGAQPSAWPFDKMPTQRRAMSLGRWA